MLTRRFWVDFLERSARAAAIVFLTAVLVDSTTSADASWTQKAITGLVGAGMSMGLSLLSALKDPNNASLVLKDAPGGDPPAVRAPVV